MFRIMSFDPGIANTGYGSLESRVQVNGNKLGPYNGVIRTGPRHGDDRTRVDLIEAEARVLLEKFKPDAVGVEDWDYRGKRTKESTTTPVLIDRLRTLCRDLEIPCYLYVNASWKRSTLGIRGATKAQVKHYVSKHAPESIMMLHRVPDHAWDAVGICFAVLKELQK